MTIAARSSAPNNAHAVKAIFKLKKPLSLKSALAFAVSVSQ
jgi:hypothetical protein